ncbi:MAG: hypothetical protein ACO3RV_05690, partial [Luteolibacter sp.]
MNDESEIDVKMKTIAPEGDAVTSHWTRAILLIGAGILILGGLITDASKLMDAWASLGRALAGQNASSGSEARFTSWNDEVIQEISALESRFNLESPLCTWVQPWVQSELARMGEGGDEVMVGNDGWLFYRKSFEHLTAQSPADRPGETHERGYEAALDAVLDFADHLQGRDIDLVIMP